MNKVFKKFDMKAPPIRQRQWLRPVTWALSFPFCGYAAYKNYQN